MLGMGTEVRAVRACMHACVCCVCVCVCMHVHASKRRQAGMRKHVGVHAARGHECVRSCKGCTRACTASHCGAFGTRVQQHNRGHPCVAHTEGQLQKPDTLTQSRPHTSFHVEWLAVHAQAHPLARTCKGDTAGGLSACHQVHSPLLRTRRCTPPRC